MFEQVIKEGYTYDILLGVGWGGLRQKQDVIRHRGLGG